MNIERLPIALKSYAGMIYKVELREAVGSVSRDLMSVRIADFIFEKHRDEAYQEVWNKFRRKPYLPEKFVMDFLRYLYQDVDITIKISS